MQSGSFCYGLSSSVVDFCGFGVFRFGVLAEEPLHTTRSTSATVSTLSSNTTPSVRVLVLLAPAYFTVAVSINLPAHYSCLTVHFWVLPCTTQRKHP